MMLIFFNRDFAEFSIRAKFVFLTQRYAEFYAKVRRGLQRVCRWGVGDCGLGKLGEN
jgi:hypothetical protein